jgi:hypothetical protein
VLRDKRCLCPVFRPRRAPAVASGAVGVDRRCSWGRTARCAVLPAPCGSRPRGRWRRQRRWPSLRCRDGAARDGRRNGGQRGGPARVGWHAPPTLARPR